MNWKRVIVILLLLAIVGFGIVYFMMNKPHKDYRNIAADFSLSANQLFDELDSDEAAKTKYMGKLVKIKGELEAVEQSADSAYILLIKADNALMGGINAKLSNTYNSNSSEISNLQEGEMIALKCRFQGFEKDLITEVKCDNCFIVKK